MSSNPDEPDHAAVGPDGVNPYLSSPAVLRDLQQAFGNRFVARLVRNAAAPPRAARPAAPLELPSPPMLPLIAQDDDEHLRPMTLAAHLLRQRAHNHRSGPVLRIGRVTAIPILYASPNHAFHALKGLSAHPSSATLTAVETDHAYAKPVKQKARNGDPRARTLGGPGAHPVVASGSRGIAVRELQEKLNCWLLRTPSSPADGAISGDRAIAADGAFGSATRALLSAFQKANGLAQTGRADRATWDRIDALQLGSSAGTFRKVWAQTVEGVTFTMDGSNTSRYTWEINDAAQTLTVFARFDFVWRDPSARDVAVIQHLFDGIKAAWNVSRIVNAASGEAYDVRFEPLIAPGGLRVTLWPGNGRSCVDHWHLGDPHLYTQAAPRAFGHFLGLEDGYGLTGAQTHTIEPRYLHAFVAYIAAHAGDPVSPDGQCDWQAVVTR